MVIPSGGGVETMQEEWDRNTILIVAVGRLSCCAIEGMLSPSAHSFTIIFSRSTLFTTR
jgi:hypothetical protein